MNDDFEVWRVAYKAAQKRVENTANELDWARIHFTADAGDHNTRALQKAKADCRAAAEHLETVMNAYEAEWDEDAEGD